MTDPRESALPADAVIVCRCADFRVVRMGGKTWKVYDDGRWAVAYDPELLRLAELVRQLRDGLAAVFGEA
jgi:hypothetical protein